MPEVMGPTLASSQLIVQFLTFSRHGLPAPRVDNPEQIIRSQSGSQNQSRRGSPRPQQYIPPAPDLHCTYQAHVYDFDDYIDCFWDIEHREFYQCNKTAHPCSNHYNSIPLLPEANPNPWGQHINRGQEPLINGQPWEAVPQPSTSSEPQPSSSSVPEAPEQPPKGDPTPPPSNSPSRHSPDPNPNPEPHSNPPDSPSPSSDPDPDPSEPDNTIDSDSDDDDDMSKATKAYDKVTKLEKDRSNWSTWVTRVQRAAGSIGYNKYLTTTPTSEAEEQQQDKDLDYKELWDALKQDYDTKDPLTEASLEKRLFSLTCTNPAQIGKHLNNLIAIMDKLAEHGVSIPDSQFKSAIISSTPDMYQTTVKALITVYREEPNKLTLEMLIAAIHAEAQGKNFTSSSNKSQESANYTNDNF
ncbi:hypothetical protein D9758_010960 [Tetrapyrgos nigripes]|uniref:Uncharacterized protein n=1 Tax=Tetrapyrgos nigripes TaxID=182062 RepID=A0A8H5LPX3_9AGAR|nr:hypothetical protein D9758_010960 [Tetrapyrgos nigripes]